MTGERNKLIWGEIVARAWRDEAFKQQLLSNPKQVLTEAGMSVADGVELQVVQDTPTIRHLVLPVAPTGPQSLSEDELDLVSGGGSTATSGSEVETPEIVTTAVTTTMGGFSTEVSTVNSAGVVVLI